VKINVYVNDTVYKVALGGQYGKEN
jgi:hypothetical protein